MLINWVVYSFVVFLKSSYYGLLSSIFVVLKLMFSKSMVFGFARKPVVHTAACVLCRKPPKPQWVIDEVIRLKAFMPKSGCRTIAYTFNRIYQHRRNMTVGKTFVYETIKKHQFEIACLRRKIKLKKPHPYPKNGLWGVDLTQVQDNHKNLYTLFGVLDAGTRMCLLLKSIPNKSSIALLRFLLDVIEKTGKPKAIRTDNEAVFVSRLFKFGLWFLGIKHQRTQVASPWQNGRIERLFATLKDKLRFYLIHPSMFHQALNDLCFWYNAVRPHQHLNGKTPLEAWNLSTPNPRKQPLYLYAWEGELTGVYCPP